MYMCSYPGEDSQETLCVTLVHLVVRPSVRPSLLLNFKCQTFTAVWKQPIRKIVIFCKQIKTCIRFCIFSFFLFKKNNDIGRTCRVWVWVKGKILIWLRSWYGDSKCISHIYFFRIWPLISYRIECLFHTSELELRRCGVGNGKGPALQSLLRHCKRPSDLG